MIIVRTPFRISLFGGSTDYQEFYSKYGSELIGFTIDKYNFLSIRKTPKILPYKTRISYSQIETVSKTEEIKHNGVRGVFEYLGIKEGLEIIHNSDIPAQTGLGSSSSFIVGLLNGLITLDRNTCNKRELAEKAIHIERVLLKESGGVQDQIWAAYGGFNSISIDSTGSFQVKPLPISQEFKDAFLERSFLIYTGHGRESFELANHGPSSEATKLEIQGLADTAYSYFLKQDIDSIGKCLEESWTRKKEISKNISNSRIDDIYGVLKEIGMIGGKLLGAGSSGFIFGIAEEGVKTQIRKTFKKDMLDFNFDNDGSKIIYQ